VKGSLDQPPIVIRGDRGKAILLLMIGVLLVAAGVWMISTDSDAGWGYVCAVFFGLGVFVAAWRIVSPGRLEISADGFRWTVTGRTRAIRWADVTRFEVVQIRSTRFVGWNYAPGYKARQLLRNVASALSGVEGSMPNGWEIAVPQLVKLLNEANQRWGNGTANL
jgi:hypothetical protein